MPLLSTRTASTGQKEPPLSEMAPRKRPFASGDAQSIDTAMAPALSPMMVTLDGSPPKAAMFSFTHFRPSIMSRRP